MRKEEVKAKLADLLIKYSDKRIPVAVFVDRLMSEGVTLQDATDTDVGDKWVSVDERFPTEEEISRAPFGRFLVSIFGVVLEAVYVNGYFAMSGGRLHSVSHWMNYPEPPKETKE